MSIPSEAWDVLQSFESYLKNSGDGEIHISHRSVQVEHKTFCICPDEESDALRKQSFFDVSVLMSSCNLVADHSSASVSGDKPALHESSYCLEQDCFGDEEAGADMIGTETELLSFKMFFIIAGKQMKQHESHCLQVEILSSSVFILRFLQLVTISMII